MSVSLTIDGVPVTAPKGTLLVEAAKSVKQQIPVYCYHTKLGPAGLCRVCLVAIEGMPKLQIACNTLVSEGMVVHTRGPQVEAGRAMILELLLVNHPLDCPICDKGGECDLQDYAMAYARGYSNVADPKLRRPKAVDLGPTIVLDEERCIVCQRCVRFDDIIADERQLVVKDRGVHDIIATATNDPYRHNFTGNVTELCPVGALTSKIYRFKSRPWDLNRTQTTCTQCSVGCQQFVDVRYGNVLRTMSVEDDDAISDGWLCDRGRYNIGFYASPQRLTQPLYAKGGELLQIGWDDAFALWAKAITASVAANGSQSVGTIGGGRLTNEESYIAQYLFRALGIRNLDWRAGRQRQATAARTSASLECVERAQAIVIAGTSVQERAPVLWLRVHKAALRAGARIVQADCADAALEAVGSATSRVVVLWDGEDLDVGRAYGRTFAGAAELHVLISNEQPNARGAEAMGMLPNFGPGWVTTQAGRDAFGMFEDARSGKLHVLSILGANPARNAPNAADVDAALQAVPFLVVSELFATETTRHAKLILPVKGAFEKSGTALNLAGSVVTINRSLDAPDGVLSDLELLVGLAQQLGVDLPTQEAVDYAVAAACVASPEVSLGDDAFTNGAPAGGNGVVPILSGGGTWQHDPTLEPLRARACSN